MTAFDRVKKLCDAKGISLREFEDEIDIGENASYKWKKFSPSAAALQKIIDYFGVSPSYILYGHSDNVTDVKKTLDGIILSLKVSNDLKFNGEELDAVAKQLLINGLENILDVTNKYLIK